MDLLYHIEGDWVLTYRMAGLEEDHEEEIAEEKIINEGMVELPRGYDFALSPD